MARKSRKYIQNEINDAISSRWEFARRNPDFQNACRDYLSSQSTQKAEQIREKYGFYPCNCKLSSKAMLRSVNKKKPSNIRKWSDDEFYATLSFIAQNPFGAIASEDAWSDSVPTIFHKDASQIKFISAFPQPKDFKNINTLRLMVNLQYPKKKVLNCIEGIIDLYQSKGAGGKGVTRSDMYSTYLRIYDLRKSGKTYRAIAEKAYKYGKDLNSSIQKVKRNYKVAERLVNGGYKEIR